MIRIFCTTTSPLRGLALRGPSGGTSGGHNAAAGSVYAPQIGYTCKNKNIPRVRTVSTTPPLRSYRSMVSYEYKFTFNHKMSTITLANNFGGRNCPVQNFRYTIPKQNHP